MSRYRMEVEMNDIRRIMAVASDIKHSREVVRYGVSLAKKYNAELVVLHGRGGIQGTAQGSQDEPDEGCPRRGLTYIEKDRITPVIRETIRKGDRR